MMHLKRERGGVGEEEKKILKNSVFWCVTTLTTFIKAI